MVRQSDVHMNRSMRMRTERGFSLIEAMIALAILSFGLLAVAGMQSFALTGNVDASELTVVSNVAADMMERIRFNWRNASAYDGINTKTGTQPAANQTAARGDYTQWLTRLTATNLSNIQGAVTVVASGPVGLQQNLVTITVSWTSRMSHTGSGSGNLGGNSTAASRTANVVLLPRTVTLRTTITPM